MTRFDFTTPIDRRGSGAIKYAPHPKFLSLIHISEPTRH